MDQHRASRSLGLGEGAAWVELTSGLYVLKGDTVMQFSASSTDTKDAAVRAKFETLAQQVVDRDVIRHVVILS